MMEDEDIRWKQRFNNYKKALSQLTKFISKGNLNELEEQGLIQAFEYTFELAWNVMKDFLIDRGNNELIVGSKDAIRAFFKLGLIEDGQGWMDMVASRNQTSHTYNEATAKEICNSIVSNYFDLYVLFAKKMEDLLQ